VKFSELQIDTVVSVAFEENCYIVRRDGSHACLLIDPGLEPDEIIQFVEREGLTPKAILNTHGHSDHIGGNAAMKRRWPSCPLVIGAGEVDKLTEPTKNLSAMFGVPLRSPAADQTVGEGDRFAAADIELGVREIPGHSSGHVVYIWEPEAAKVVFCGDVIFAGSIGRTDFPDGNFEQLTSGIHQKLFTLADETVLLSGHGPPTTVGREKRSNPFVGQRPLA